MFTREGARALKKDLTNTRALCGALGNPQDRLKTIHVAGTNGKGSTSHALAAILQQAGYRTGLYTSPHLVDFRERIRVDGLPIPPDAVVDFVQANLRLIDDVKPSFFEVTVAMAFDYFVKAEVEIAVIETGLGGRLDSTNIIVPELSIITNIGMDHADILGESLQDIAKEKAGIIKAGVPVVVSEFQEPVAEVFRRCAQTMGSTLVFASEQRSAIRLSRDLNTQEVTVAELATGDSTLYRMDLQGSYQAKNLLGILSAVAVLRDKGWAISDAAVREALAQVQRLTGLQGRWQTLAQHPMLVCDTGHNADGWRVVLENIAQTPFRQLRMVVGVMKDKDLSNMLPLLPDHAIYYFCQVDMPRALSATALAAAAAEWGLIGRPFNSVAEAVGMARIEADAEDLIFVGGSTFVVGELLTGWST